MNVSTVILAHGNTEVVQDTLESVHTWVGPNVFVVGDGDQSEWLDEAQLSAHKKCGFSNSHVIGSYRNQVYGLDLISTHFPDSDWYILGEYDILFGNDDFKKDLKSRRMRG